MERIEELLTCPVCLDRFKEPKILPCQHTFCLRPCLQNIAQDNSIRCPECRSRHFLSRGGAEGLPANLTIVKFLDLPTQQRPPRQQCKGCKVGDSDVSKCNHCDESLCRSCIASHTRGLQQDLHHSLTQARRLVPKIAESVSDLRERTKKCQENGRHMKRAISQSIELLQSELQSRKNCLFDEVDALVAMETGSFEREQDELEVKMAALTTHCQVASEKCKRPLTFESTLEIQRFQNEILALAQDGNENLRSNGISSDKVRQTIEFTNSDEGFVLSAISNFGTVSAHEHLTYGVDLTADHDQARRAPRFGRRADRQQRDSQPAREEPRARRDPVAAARGAPRPRANNRRRRDVPPPVYFSIGSEDPSPPAANNATNFHSHVTGVRTTLWQYRGKGQVKKHFGTKGFDAGRMNFPRGISSTAADDIVVADSSNHRVQIFDLNGDVKGILGSYGKAEGQFDCVADVCVTCQGWVVASDRYNHRIKIFDETGRFVRAFGCKGSGEGQLSFPWGVATDDRGQIYVCDKDNRRVQVLSTGEVVRTFGSEENRLNSPQYLSVAANGRVVVGDSGSHRVHVFDEYGRHLFELGMEGTNESHFRYPRGVATDQHGNIIVGDSGNNRVQVFTSDGAFVSCFGSWGSEPGQMKGLEGICILSDGSVAVGDRDNHRVQIF